MAWYSASDPGAYELSQVLQLWAKHWGHVRETCESGGISKKQRREYGLEIGFGDKSPALSVCVVAPPDTASVGAMCERSDASCPWTLFQVPFDRRTATQETMARTPDPRPSPDAPRERSRDEFGGTGSRLPHG